MIHNQILQTSIIRITWQIVRRMCNKILGVKGSIMTITNHTDDKKETTLILAKVSVLMFSVLGPSLAILGHSWLSLAIFGPTWPIIASYVFFNLTKLIFFCLLPAGDSFCVSIAKKLPKIGYKLTSSTSSCMSRHNPPLFLTSHQLQGNQVFVSLTIRATDWAVDITRHQVALTFCHITFDTL